MRHAILGRFGAGARNDDEEELLDSLYRQHCGDRAWPGDSRQSENWPGVAPGDWGPMNAISPKFFNAWPPVELERKPPIIRIQGDSDVIISDASQFDTATFGMMGVIPGWPGMRPQPMVSQMTHLLETYRNSGGLAVDNGLPGCGHAARSATARFLSATSNRPFAYGPEKPATKRCKSANHHIEPKSLFGQALCSRIAGIFANPHPSPRGRMRVNEKRRQSTRRRCGSVG